MKQLKFFTNQVGSLHATENALRKGGIDQHNLRVFTRPNKQRRYDGLILASQGATEQVSFSTDIVLIVFAMFAGSIALYNHLVDFSAFAVICMAMFMLPLALSYFRSNIALHKNLDENVYFIVVNVDEKEEGTVANILNQQPGILIT